MKCFTGVKNLCIITPSMWLKELVRDSFLHKYDVRVINNGIDLDRFRIVDAFDADIVELKKKYDIEEKHVVLGVAGQWTERKGLQSFYGLAKLLDEDYRIILIGVNSSVISYIDRKYGGRVTGIRRTQSIRELTLWYNIADVCVNPTLEDNFPTTNIEALACGTPVITYATGGSPESIDDSCGKTLKKEDIDELASAVRAFAQKKPELSAQCRERAIKYYNMNDRLAEYVEIMESM